MSLANARMRASFMRCDVEDTATVPIHVFLGDRYAHVFDHRCLADSDACVYGRYAIRERAPTATVEVEEFFADYGGGT